MGAAFFSPGTIRIRDALEYAFGQFNVANNARAYGRLFNPTNGATLFQIADQMDVPPINDPDWGSGLHGRFVQFLTTLFHRDPTTHTQIKTAIYGALTANPPMPIKFHLAHQNAGYQFIHWTEEDAAQVTWLYCLLFCPTMPGPLAGRLRRLIARRKGRRKKTTRRRK